MEEEEKKLLTVMEFAKILRVSPQTVRKAIKRGKIQAFRCGVSERSGYRIPAMELQRISEFDMMKVIERIVEEKMEARK